MLATILTFSLAGYFVIDLLTAMTIRKTGKPEIQQIALKLLCGFISAIILVAMAMKLHLT